MAETDTGATDGREQAEAANAPNLDELDAADLHIIARKVVEMLRRDLLVERERLGRRRDGSGWRR